MAKRSRKPKQKKEQQAIVADPTLADRPAVAGLGRPIRKLRHWKQQYDKNACFVWRRDVHWDADTDFKKGEPVPDGLINPVKLRRFWESQWIELLEFEEVNVVTGRPEPVPEPEQPNTAPDPEPVVIEPVNTDPVEVEVEVEVEAPREVE